jgi:hypothetical protein
MFKYYLDSSPKILVQFIEMAKLLVSNAIISFIDKKNWAAYDSQFILIHGIDLE